MALGAILTYMHIKKLIIDNGVCYYMIPRDDFAKRFFDTWF